MIIFKGFIKKLFIFNFQLLLFLVSSSLLAQTSEVSNKNQDEISTKTSYPKKVKSKQLWEQVLSLPGEIITLPFFLIEKTMDPIFNVVVDKKIIARTVDLLTSNDGKRGVFPTYESKIGGGLKFFQRDFLTPGSKLNLIASIGLYSRQFYQIQLKNMQLGGPYIVEFSAHFQNLSDEPFYGIGNDSKFINKSNFALEQVSLGATIGTNIFKNTYLTTTFGFDRNDILKGRNTKIPSTTDISPQEKASIPGLNDKINLYRLQFQLEQDSRNRLGNPSAGWQTIFRSSFYTEAGGETYGFWQTSADLTRYFHLFYNRTLVLRAALQVTEPHSKRQIPFYYLSELGRRETIRGFSRGRFLDEDMALASVEYRYPITKRERGQKNWDVVIFMDTGKVSPNIFKNFSTERFHTGFGGGIRMFGVKGTWLQILLGKSTDEYRFYLVLN